MSDLTSGLFALGGALIGAFGTQVTAIISATSKSRTRKAKAAEAARADRAARRRPLYETYLSELHAAADFVGWLYPRHTDGQVVAAIFAYKFNEQLTKVRDSSIRIQVDGSDEAVAIATQVLTGIAVLAFLISQSEPVSRKLMNTAHAALTKAEPQMIAAARKDIGG
jgi:leucyl aminopeptidase